MAENNFLEDLRRKEEAEALLTSRGQISLARPNVQDLQGDDPFQAQLKGLKKLPSTIPRINDETRKVYKQYKGFLDFAGAATGDYSGSKAFQTGISSSLDLDMIQDLLEEQRENTFASQFNDMLPFIKNRGDVTKFALGVNANLAETEKAQNVFMKSRPDLAYANQAEDLRDAVRTKNTNTALGHAVNLIEAIELNAGRELTAVEQREAVQDALFGFDDKGEPRLNLKDTNVVGLLEGLDKILDVSGGLTGTSGYITFTNRFSDDKATKDYKSTRTLLEEIGIRKDQYRIKDDEIIINPRTQFPVNQTDPGTAGALQQLQARGASWYPYSPASGQIMRLRDRTTLQPMLEPFNSNNIGLMEQMRRYADTHNAEIVPDMTPKDWEAAKYNIPLSELGHYTAQYNAATRIRDASKEGLALVDLGAGGVGGKIRYTLRHVQEWAADVAGVSKELETIEEIDKAGKVTTRQETNVERDQRIAIELLRNARDLADEVLYAGGEELKRNPDGVDEKANMKLAQKLADDIDYEMRNLPKDQYGAQIYLKFLEVSLRAQVARMHIEKDRMLATFYVAMSGAINLTGWLQTDKGARNVLEAVQRQSSQIANQKLQLISPKEASPERQDPYGTFYTEGQGQPQYEQGALTREQELIKELQALGVEGL